MTVYDLDKNGNFSFLCKLSFEISFLLDKFSGNKTFTIPKKL